MKNAWIGAALGVLGLAVALPLSAAAQDKYPSREITMIVPFAAGGGTDQVARAISEALKGALGRPVTVQNLPGAGSAVGLTRLSEQKSDGYAVGMMGGFMVSTSLRGQLKVPLADFTPLARLSQETFVLGVPANSPYKTMQDYLAAARKSAGAVSVGTAGAGALTHLAAAALGQQAKAQLNIVHFDGGAKLTPAVLGGHADSGIFSQVEVLPHIGPGGGMRVLASFGDKRTDKLPDVPTLTELGIKGVPSGAWQGIVAPKALPEPIKAALLQAITKANQDAGWKEFLAKSGLTPFYATGPAFDTFLKSEVEQIGALLKAIGL